MSFRDATTAQYLGTGRLKPATSTPILRASVEAKRVSDLCTGAAAPDGARERILAWLADGARDVTWALCALPRDRWAAPPPTAGLHPWPALRHVRHLALRESAITLPTVRRALGNDVDAVPSTIDLGHADAVWDAAAALESAEAIMRDLGSGRFELLQLLEAAPDEAWERPLTVAGVPESAGFLNPVQLEWLLLDAHQHELEHLAAIWRVALDWDHASPTLVPGGTRDTQATGLALHPADRLEESH
jgi:hypothetical protein